MSPEEAEFLAEKQNVEIVPNFSHEKLYLICGEVGPFRPGIPVQVPLWIAVNLRQRQKCRFIAPAWLNVETLTNVKETELQLRTFSKMPDEFYMNTAQLLLNTAAIDIPNADEVRTLIKDIWDMRVAKLRSSVDAFLKSGGIHAKLDHLTLMEINTVRPFLPHALDQLFRLRQETKPNFNHSQSQS